MRYCFTLITILILVACQQPHYTKVVYEHSDGSLPPEYYRRYKLKAENDSLQVEVRNYEKTLWDTAFVLTEANMDSLKTLAKAHERGTLVYNDQVDGASTDWLKLYSKKGLEIEYRWNRGNSAPVEAIIDYLESLVPNLEEAIRYTPPKPKSSGLPQTVESVDTTK